MQTIKELTSLGKGGHDDFTFYEKQNEKADRLHQAEVAELQEEEDESSDEQPSGLKNCLKNLTIVVSGVFLSITREEMENTIKRLGGKQTGSVSGKTDYLVIGHQMEDGREITQGGKYRKAKEKGTKIVDETQFE